MDKVEYVQIDNGELYAYIDNIIVQYNDGKWTHSPHSITTLKKNHKCKKIAMTKALIMTKGVSADKAINTIICTE